MYHKYTLLVGGAQYELPSSCLKNWDNIISAIARNNYDGIQRTFTSKFEFVNQAYSLLKAEYKANYLSASATIIFSRRNNSWTYNETFRCKLDFSDMEDDGFTFSISGVDDSMKNIIKANGGTEYEFNVDELAHFERLVYDGIEVEQSVKWTITGDSENNGSTSLDVSAPNIYKNTVPLYEKSKEVLHNNSIEFQDLKSVRLLQDLSDIISKGAYFAKALKKTSVKLKGSFKAKCSTGSVMFNCRKISNKSGVMTETIIAGEVLNTYEREIVFPGVNDIQLDVDDVLLFDVGNISSGVIIYFSDANIELSWTDRRASTIKIPFITPTRLLSALVARMTGDDSNYGTIDTTYDQRLNGTLLLAGESIRGISGAKIYTNFNKFRDWMSATFGYTYDTEGYNIVFRHRSQEFDKTVVKTIEHYNNCIESVNNKIIYSRVKAGYDKQDYEEVNGRDAYHFGIVFSTGLTLNNAELNLISPYRCDPLGIEILAMKQGQNTTDNSSDKNIFFVGATRKYSQGDIVGYYILDRTPTVSNVISPDSQFNAMFSPRASIKANKQLIGACTRKLTFASSEGNSDVAINEVGESDDFIIAESDRIFTVDTISFETPDVNRPENFKGIIELKHRDGSKFGYIDELEINEGKESAAKYSLIKRV